MPISGWPSDISGIDPMVSGNIQLQQISVIGFINCPWQVEPATAGPTMMRFASKATVTKPREMGELQQFIDAQSVAVLRDERGNMTDPKSCGEGALLIKEYGLLQATHEFEIGAAGQDEL